MIYNKLFALQRLYNNESYRLAENSTWICTFIFISHRILRGVRVKGVLMKYEKQNMHVLRNYY